MWTAQRIAGGGSAMRTAIGNGLTRANERAKRKRKSFASVAIDGYCTRKRAERMIVRNKRT